MVNNEGNKLKAVVLCRPKREYFCIKEKDLGKHNITKKAQNEFAIYQHNKLSKVIRDSGVTVVMIDELKGHPNSVFTQDMTFLTNKGYIKLNMGIDSRVGEDRYICKLLDSMNIPKVASLSNKAKAEGGDLIMAGDVIFMGISSRTNELAAMEMGAVCRKLGKTLRVAEVPPPFLHIGGAMSVIAPNRIIYVEGALPNRFFKGYESIPVPNNNFVSANVITIKPNKVIAEISNTETIDILKNVGVEVIELDLSEFIKGTGGPSCLILPIKRI